MYGVWSIFTPELDLLALTRLVSCMAHALVGALFDPTCPVILGARQAVTRLRTSAEHDHEQRQHQCPHGDLLGRTTRIRTWISGHIPPCCIPFPALSSVYHLPGAFGSPLIYPVLGANASLSVQTRSRGVEHSHINDSINIYVVLS